MNLYQYCKTWYIGMVSHRCVDIKIDEIMLGVEEVEEGGRVRTKGWFL